MDNWIVPANRCTAHASKKDSNVSVIRRGNCFLVSFIFQLNPCIYLPHTCECKHDSDIAVDMFGLRIFLKWFKNRSWLKWSGLKICSV